MIVKEKRSRRKSLKEKFLTSVSEEEEVGKVGIIKKTYEADLLKTNLKFTKEVIDKVVCQLYVSCKDLKFPPKEPKNSVCRIIEIKKKQPPKIIGITERFRDSFNPEYCRPFQVEYNFSSLQELKLEVFLIKKLDEINLLSELNSKLPMIGSCVCKLGEICAFGSSRYFEVGLRDENKSKAGKAFVHFDSLCKEIELEEEEMRCITFKIGGKNLKRVNDNLFFIISKTVKGDNPDDTYFKEVYRSEILKNKTFNPEWSRVKIQYGLLCDEDDDQQLQFTLYGGNKRSNKNEEGSFTFTLNEIKKNYKLKNVKRYIVKDLLTGEKRGNIQFRSYFQSAEAHPTYDRLPFQGKFLKYLQKYQNLEIDLIVAIDFTSSNLNPNDKDSLHFICSDKPNEYQKAIDSVAQIVACYDSDQLFPVLGFGGCPKEYNVSHCFALNGDNKHPECDGIDGIMKEYQRSLIKYKLSGGTKFSEVLEYCNKYISKKIKNLVKNPKYFILMILTDGFLDKEDEDNTIKQIIECSNLPFSVVIVGIGKATFKSMKKFVQEKLSTDNENIKRNFVQFLEFNDFKEDGEVLAQNSLKRVPEEMVEFFESKLEHMSV